MRFAWLMVIAAVGCGGGPNQGAVLTFATPGGPIAASRIEVILANAADTAITDVDGQRVEPGDTDTTTARYFRQRAIGGAVTGMTGLDGFEIRIEPDLATSTDSAFVPIVLVYDGNDKLVAIGHVPGADGDPSAVTISPNELATYDVAVTPVVTVASAESSIDRGTVLPVACYDQLQKPWTSGYAWFPPGAAHQLRLLLPDAARDATATDATDRALDLDCDAHPADSADCDDLRPAFFAGAGESCDGLDTNCDSQRWMPEACPAGNCSMGVRLCDDNAGTETACVPSAQCLCAGNPNGPYCNRCIVDFTGTTTARTACSPSVGQIHLGMCETTSCTVEVGGATLGWRAFIGTADAGPFSTKLTGAHTVFLEVKRTGSLPTSAGSIGEVYLIVTPAAGSGPATVPVQLEMSAGTDQCTPINGTTSGAGSKMTCTP